MTKENIQPPALKVDIKEVFKNKNPKLAAMIPGFIFRYLKKIAHEDEVNDFLSRHGHKKNLDFVRAAIEDFNVNVRLIGENNLPSSGRYVFVSNHTLGGFDGLIIMDVLSRYYKNFKFLVNDILMNLTPLHGLFIPINKHGKQGFEAARKIDETFQSDIQIITFPAGLVSRRIKGQIVDPVWHKNFISKAVQYKRDVIPIHMSGRNTNFFYNLSKFRKFLGIKSNIEMLYLVDETYKHKNKSFEMIIGPIIPWETFDRSKKPIEWAKYVKQKVYELDGIKSIPL
ncbi:MAG: 1-acyl-sn-glycerol-3-phosphate acyltransferase [Bacteroidales bacterium]|nr:1-acyl-sn-glycerol-3-phosphate acyltransferase [Bacteroidales bacterium]